MRYVIKEKENVHMKKKLFVLLAVIVMLLIVSISALAGPLEEADGVWCYTPDSIAVEKVAGGNEFWTTSETAVWTGTFDGESVDHCRAVIHSSGAWWGVCEISFDSVSVIGETGSLDMFAIVRRPSVFDEWDGSWTITSGTGALQGLRGQGTMSGPGWLGGPACGVIDYSGNIHFEP
jgi:hypothetical protein